VQHQGRESRRADCRRDRRGEAGAEPVELQTEDSVRIPVAARVSRPVIVMQMHRMAEAGEQQPEQQHGQQPLALARRASAQKREERRNCRHVEINDREVRLLYYISLARLSRITVSETYRKA
jgi:hypothetical protein